MYRRKRIGPSGRHSQFTQTSPCSTRTKYSTEFTFQNGSNGSSRFRRPSIGCTQLQLVVQCDVGMGCVLLCGTQHLCRIGLHLFLCAGEHSMSDERYRCFGKTTTNNFKNFHFFNLDMFTDEVQSDIRTEACVWYVPNGFQETGWIRSGDHLADNAIVWCSHFYHG